MSDLNILRMVVSDIEDGLISLEERDRLSESEELIHLTQAYKSTELAALCCDNSDVWSELDQLEQLIEQRLDEITWRDSEMEGDR